MDQFTRREVSRALLIGALTMAGRVGGSAGPAAMPLFDFAVAGGWFHGLKDLGPQLAIGQALELRPEPDNPHDRHAVAVHLRGGLRLGYVPRAANEPVSALLRGGAAIEASVVGRLDIEAGARLPDDLVFTGFTSGDPRVRLTLL